MRNQTYHSGDDFDNLVESYKAALEYHCDKNKIGEVRFQSETFARGVRDQDFLNRLLRRRQGFGQDKESFGTMHDAAKFVALIELDEGFSDLGHLERVA